MDDASELLRELPSVDEILRGAAARRLADEFSAAFVTEHARRLIAGWRDRVRAGDLDHAALGELRRAAGDALERAVRGAAGSTLTAVVNATGVVVHTNLGRAPWPEAVAARALEMATRYSNLEYDLERGERGAREAHLEVTRRLFGAEAAVVVNNNAAAVLLVLNTLAEGRETIVSRGELVEIGGSFRIPDILEKSGSKLVEVGTTNRTHLADYARAIGGDTALILRVHPSNYRVLGFTASVELKALTALGRERGVPVVEDLGSGDVVDLAPAGVADEPTVASSLAAGTDLVTFSGDKLLGGPQAGIVVGRADLVARLSRNPLYRALRPDKVTMAALAELLAIYETRDPWSEVPVLRMLAARPAALEARARKLADELGRLGFEATLVAGASTVGGGASPLSALPTPMLAVLSRRLPASAVAAALRRHRPPVIARIEGDCVIVDLRAVRESEDAEIVAAFAACHG